MKNPFSLYSEKSLRQFTTEFLISLGAKDEEATIVADGLMTASLWWHPGQGQGLEKLIRYHRRVANGGIVPGVEMEWIRDEPSVGILDAKKGFGYVAAHRAMQKAIQKAGETGIAMVGVRNSNHFGMAGYHALSAAREGLIGWAMTNAGSEMAPTGSSEAVLGTNPWGIAIPRLNKDPVVLDMALTMSGKGMMRFFHSQGLEMPDSWALTPKGEKTISPAEALSGTLLPIGEYKGYGLSLWTDVLAGVMTGALFGTDVFQGDTHFDVGHQMGAIQPDLFGDRKDFDRRLEELFRQVKTAAPIDPARPVLLPGEMELARSELRRAEGVPVRRETVQTLQPLAVELGIIFPDEKN